MRTMIGTKIRRRARAAMLAAIMLTAATFAGCDDWLQVTNPGALESPTLEDPVYIDLMVNGVIGDFQPAFAWTALFSGGFTDELRNHHGFFENGDIDRRDVGNTNGTYIAAVYNGLHRARFLADSVAGRIRVLLADSASRSLDLARVLAYGGYTYTLLGEQMCETPLDRSAPVPSDELFAMALERFGEAITVAGAAKEAAEAAIPSAPDSLAEEALAALAAGADSVANFARVAAARASLNLDDRSAAIAFATAVIPAYASEASPGFEFYAHYLEGASFSENRRTGNPFGEFLADDAEIWFSVSETPFEGLNDPRVPQALQGTVDGTQQLVPNSSASFSTHDGTPEGAPFEKTSSIRIASALEARYTIAEAGGMTDADLRDFIDGRRAVGGQGAFAGTDAELFAELLEQRARDFFVDGHRMGDLRRYEDLHGLDLWPGGPYFGSETVQYGTQKCWPVPLVDQ